MTIYDLIPDPEVLLALDPEELAGPLLQVLSSLPDDSGLLNRYNFTLTSNVPGEYGHGERNAICRALMEAWTWLERENLIAIRPDSRRADEYFVTRRGKRLADSGDFQSYRNGNLLPKQQLHPVIAQKVWSPFLRGEYETAVFQAFKEVEVAARDAGGFPVTEIGVPLMRKAFHPSTGPLTDLQTPEAEREALAALFAGAIGSYKNPHSHRHVSISPEESVEMIIMASHLLRIVDSRRKGSPAP